MSSSVEEMRLKIKKLKYKIDKSQKMHEEYTGMYSRLRRFDQEKLSVGRVLKKINFLLSLKGMTMMDWVRACPYDDDLQIDRMVVVLERMGLKLPREENNLLTNFMGDHLSELMTLDDFRKILEHNGLGLDE